MKLKHLLSLSLLTGLASLLSPPAQAELTQKDLKLAEKYFERYIYELEQPILVYNWSPAALKLKSATDPMAYKYVASSTRTYWQAQNNVDEDDNMYGRGLYAALDPVATRSYGKWSGTWVLLEMQLPKGFRMLDLNRDGQNSFPERIQSILRSVNCPINWDDKQGMFSNLMSPKVPKIDAQCMALIKHIFQKTHAIDGFAYGYNSTSFMECQDPSLEQTNAEEGYYGGSQRKMRSTAFVITGSNWLRPELVKLYTPATRDAITERKRILSLFYRSQYDNVMMQVQTPEGAASWAQNEAARGLDDYRSMNEYGVCNNFVKGQGCLDPIKLCKLNEKYETIETECITKPAPPIPVYDTTKMTSANFPDEAWEENAVKGLLWPDLEGANVDVKIGEHISKNFIGCSDAAPYKLATPLKK